MSLLRLHKLVYFHLGESLLPAGVPTSRNCAPLQKDPCRVLRVIDVEKSLFCVALALLAAVGLAFVRLWRCSSAHIALGAQQTNLGSLHLAQMAASPGSPMAAFYVCLAVVAQSIWPTLLLWSIVTAELAALHIGLLEYHSWTNLTLFSHQRLLAHSVLLLASINVCSLAVDVF